MNPGYANMISNVTNSNVGIDDFKAPAECCIRPVQFGERRVQEQGSDDITLRLFKGLILEIVSVYCRNMSE